MSEEYKIKYPKIYNMLYKGFASSDVKEVLESLETEAEYEFVENLVKSSAIYVLAKVLKKDYRDRFGSDFIFRHCKELHPEILDLAVHDDRSFEIMKCLDNNEMSLDFIAYRIIEDENVDRDFVEKIIPLLKDEKYSLFLFDDFKYTDKGIEFLNKAVDGENFEKTILDFIVNKYDEFQRGHYTDLVEKEDRESLYKFIKLMPNEYFNNKSTIKRFLKLYHKTENLMKDIDVCDVDDTYIKNNFRTYIMDNNKDMFNIDTKDKLLDIYNIRYDYYKEKIENSENVNKIKGYITKNYFNMGYNTYLAKMEEIENVDFKTYFFPVDSYSEYKDVLEISKLNSKSELIDYYSKMKDSNIYSYFDKMNNDVRCAYQNDFVNGLTKLPHGKQIIEYDGEEFSFLVHKIVGFGNRKMAEKIYENPELWMKSAKSYLDVSLVEDDYMGVVDGSGFMFILNDIKPSEVVAMGTYDIYTDYNNVSGEVINLKEEWMLKDDLRKVEVAPFDNHAIKKDDSLENKVFMPSGVLCFDKVDDKALEVSDIFDIPIVVINRESYMDKQEEKLKHDIDKRDGDSYYVTKIQMFMSIRDNKNLVNKYFSDDKMYKEACDFIKNIDYCSKDDFKMLSSILKTNLEISCNTCQDLHFYNEKDLSKIAAKKKLLK